MSGSAWCHAPASHLYLTPWGEVRSCCLQRSPLGNVRDQSFLDIWRGSQRAALVSAVSVGDLSLGCQTCASQDEIEGRSATYAATFDVLPDQGVEGWPTLIEFNLSNACNLQCIQCNADLSSAIRAHQTDLPPIPKVYGDGFFRDLELFLPHLERAQFAGGEPFLAPENFRVWDLIATQAPHVACTVVTNGTIWNRRVEEVLGRIPMDIVLSLDGASRETYESIRVGASFEVMEANLDRFVAHARGCGSTVSINHCLMVQNHHEFADLLLFAEAREIAVDVSVVRGPERCSIAHLDDASLRQAADRLRSLDPVVGPKLRLNRACWDTEVERLTRWAEAGQDRRREAILETAYGTSFDFRPDASDTVDHLAIRSEVRAFAGGDQVHELRVVREAIADHTPGIEALLHVDEGWLIGRAPGSISEQAVVAFGPLLSETVTGTPAERVVVTAEHERASILMIAAPEPDGSVVMHVGIRWIDRGD